MSVSYWTEAILSGYQQWIITSEPLPSAETFKPKSLHIMHALHLDRGRDKRTYFYLKLFLIDT